MCSELALLFNTFLRVMERRLQTMLLRIYLGIILLMVIGCGSSPEDTKVDPVEQVIEVVNTPTSITKSVDPTPTKVPVVPTKTSVSAPTASAKVVVVATKVPVSKPTAPTKTEVSPSPTPEITPTAQPSASPVSASKPVDKDSSIAERKTSARENLADFAGCDSTPVLEQKTKSNLPEKEQIAGLSEIASSYFSGTNNTDLPRLKIPPDVRKSRRGGIVVNIEFNGDEYPTLLEKKAGLDCIMRDGYEVLYSSGYDISEVTMTAIMVGLVRGNVGGSGLAPIMVMKTGLKQDAASKVDWSKKNDKDFRAQFDILMMNPEWKQKLGYACIQGKCKRIDE